MCGSEGQQLGPRPVHVVHPQVALPIARRHFVSCSQAKGGTFVCQKVKVGGGVSGFADHEGGTLLICHTMETG